MENKIANPGPLGLAGFALTTFFLSLINAGILKVGASDILVVVGLAVFYGGIAQFAAGMWEFRTGNTFGAVAFTSYGAFWLSFAALLIPGFGIGLGTKTGPSVQAVGWYLLAWGIFTALMTIGALRVHGALFVLFLLLAITYFLLAVGWLNPVAAGGPDTTWVGYGGYVGIVVAIIAWYIALEGVLAGVSGGKWKLPTFPLFRA